MGTPDRIARFAIGALLIVLTLTGTIGVWGWLGIIPIATAALNFCPAYTLLGVNTCGR
jgi:O-antigen ligase